MANETKISVLITADAFGAVNGMRMAGDETEKLAGRTQTVTQQLKAHWMEFTAGVMAAYLAMQRMWGFMEIAANYEEAMTTLNALTRQYGMSAEQFVGQIQDASHGLISMKDAASVANDALLKGFSPQQVAQIAEWSVVMEHASGGTRTAAEAFRSLEETMATGRERGVVKLLGTTIDLHEAYGKYADVMSKAEKRQAIFNLAQERMAQVQKTLGEQTDSTADKLHRFLADIENLKITIGDVLIRVGAGLMATFQSVAALAMGLARVVMAPITALMMATDYLGITKDKAEGYKADMEALAEAAEYTAKQADANFKLMWEGKGKPGATGGAPLSSPGGDASRKAYDELEALFRKYNEERATINQGELNRELQQINNWYDEQVKKLNDLHAAQKYYDALYADYSDKYDKADLERSAKIAEMEIKAYEKKLKDMETLERAHSDAVLAEQERAVKLRTELANIAAGMGTITEQEQIKARFDGERELLELQSQRVLGEIREEMTMEQILVVLEKFAQIQKQITESKTLEAAETDRANLKSDTDRQIRIFNDGLGKQKLLIDEASAKVRAYQQLWNYAHTTMTGYTAQLLDVGMKVFQGLEDNITKFVMTGKMKFREFADSVISDLVRIAVRASITQPLAGMFMGGMSLLGLAGGGSVSAGVPYVVGERGPELFVPQTSGQIIPTAGGGSQNVRVEIVNNSGQPMAVKSSQAQVNPQELVIGIVIDGIQNNVMGLRTVLGGA